MTGLGGRGRRCAARHPREFPDFRRTESRKRQERYPEGNLGALILGYRYGHAKRDPFRSTPLRQPRPRGKGSGFSRASLRAVGAGVLCATGGLFAASASSALGGSGADASPEVTTARPVKLLIINMFGPEAQPFITNLQLTDDVVVPGLSPDYPKVHCNADAVCELTTGMGHTNVAASVSALQYSGLFDLSSTYFLIAGITGIDPTQGTLGSAAWAHYLVDFRHRVGDQTRGRYPPRGAPDTWASTPRRRARNRRSTTGPRCSSSIPPSSCGRSSCPRMRRWSTATRRWLTALTGTSHRPRILQGRAMRHRGGGYLVAWRALGKASPRLDQTAHRRQGHLLHDAARRQRHLRGAQARRRCWSP